MNSAKGDVSLERKAPREKLLAFKNFIVDGLVAIEDPYSNL